MVDSNKDNFNKDNKINDNFDFTQEKNQLEDEIIKLKEKNILLEKDLEFLKNSLGDEQRKIVYLRSDIENIRRNSIKEAEKISERSTKKIILEMLNIYDDFERCLSVEFNNSNLSEGLLMIKKSFDKSLVNLGIEEIKTDIPFDPNIHEAIYYLEDKEKETGSIHSVVKKGYLLNNNLIRPAQVAVVSNN